MANHPNRPTPAQPTPAPVQRPQTAPTPNPVPIDAKPDDSASTGSHVEVDPADAPAQPAGQPGHAHHKEVGTNNGAIPNPITTKMGLPSFVLGDRKVYPDERVAGKSSQTLGKASFLVGGIVSLTATIYLDQQILGANQKPRRDLRLSLPRQGWKLIDSGEVAASMPAWKREVLNGFRQWLSDTGGAIAASQGSDSSSVSLPDEGF